MLAPQSETLEEIGVVATFVRAIAGADENISAWGYAGIAIFLCSAPEGSCLLNPMSCSSYFIILAFTYHSCSAPAFGSCDEGAHCISAA